MTCLPSRGQDLFKRARPIEKNHLVGLRWALVESVFASRSSVNIQRRRSRNHDKNGHRCFPRKLQIIRKSIIDENLFSRFAFKLYLIRVFAFAWVVFTCMSRLMPESFSSAPKKWLTHESFVQAFFINLSHSSRLSSCLSHFPDNKWRARNPVRQIFFAWESFHLRVICPSWVVLPESFAHRESFYLNHLLTVSHFTWVVCSPWVTLPELWSRLTNPDEDIHFRKNYMISTYI